MLRTGWIIGACLLASGWVWAEAGKPARPTETTVVADFQEPASLDLWTGLPHESAQAPDGSTGMKFAVPLYHKGEEERPGVALPVEGWPGAPGKNLSRYGAIAVDVRVEGDHPGKMGLKLRDASGDSSWTTHITVEPGKWNTAELSIADASADCDITDIKEVVLYALRPETAYTLVVDNLRLLPGEKPPLARFSLVYPNYRGLIMPDGGPVEVAVEAEFEEYGLRPKETLLEATIESGDVRVEERRRGGRVALPTQRLPIGPATLKAALVRRSTGEVLANQQWPVRKIDASEQAGLKSYVDRANNLIVDGKPFFPLGWYGNTREDYLAEIADSPFNCLLAYATNHVPKDRMRAFLDEMDKRGMKLVYCLNDVYPTATYFEGKTWEGVAGNDAIAKAVVEAYRDHPSVIAWYLNDELPHKLVPELEDYYGRVKEADPTRPCFIVLCNRSELRYFPTTTDILGVDPYPVPNGKLTEVSKFTDAGAAAMGGTKPVWQVPQAFAWYQYKSENQDRGHTPTEEELKSGRAPTYEEERCMTYLALTHGAKGLIYYCYYDLRVLPQYAEMWGWMKKIGEEVKTLSPMLLSPDDRGPVAFEPAASPIHTKLKAHDGRLYLMAVNSGTEAVDVTFELPEKAGRSVTVMFEDRSIEGKGRRFTDGFKPLEAHVYDLGPSR